MGDSPCLMQPFCYASGLTNESNESNPIHALGQSVSFGRFVSESLAWEKWSSFSHNRYVEEAERYSRPGSVAQKKAFFEAHYKKLAAQKAAAAAAALLQQANNAAAATQNNDATEKLDEAVTAIRTKQQLAAQNNATSTRQVDEFIVDSNNISAHNSESTTSTDSKTVVLEEKGERVSGSSMLRANDNDSGSNVVASNVIPQRCKVEGAQPEMELQACTGNLTKIELRNHLEDSDGRKVQTEKISVTPPIMTPILKKGSNYTDQQVLASIGKKKPSVSSFKLLKANGASNVNSTPVKSTVPLVSSSKSDNVVTSTNPKSNKKHADRKRSTPNSLQMSVNFTPIRELNRLTASLMRRFESARPFAAASSMDTAVTPLRTPTMGSKKEIQKHSILTPLAEKGRHKTPLDLSSTGNHTGSSKWRLPPSENKIRSPIVISSPFSLRTEERAARRQKKLEEKFNVKFNANEAQKVQLHTKIKEKAETEIRKLRQSFCFKARPLPDFYKERKASNNETKTDPLTPSELTPEGTKMVESKTFLSPPQRPSLKNNGTKSFQGKSGRRTFNTHENTSPNIQQGNRNYRYYK